MALLQISFAGEVLAAHLPLLCHLTVLIAVLYKMLEEIILDPGSLD